MRIEQKLVITFLVVGLMLSCSGPANAHNNRIRIHVPTNIRTVYKTKIVKVPQHHHYFHEKIKEVPKYIPLPAHYEHHKPLYDDHQPAYDNHHPSYDHHKPPYDHHNNFDQDDAYEHYDRHRYPYHGY